MYYLFLTLVFSNTVCSKVEVADTCSSEVLGRIKNKEEILEVAQHRLSLESGLPDSMQLQRTVLVPRNHSH